MWCKQAQDAIDYSGSNDDCVTYCRGSEENIKNLRAWANESRRTGGNAYGETATPDGLKFEGWEGDEEGNVYNWTVIVLDSSLEN